MTELNNVGIGSLDTEELEVRLVPDHCELATFGAGEELRHKGIHYSNMYLIVRSRVDVVLDGQPAPVAMGPGSPVGEIGFMKGCPATVTATAREDSTVLVLDDATLWRIEQEEPELSISLLRAIVHTAQYRLDRDARLGVEQTFEAASGMEVCSAETTRCWSRPCVCATVSTVRS